MPMISATTAVAPTPQMIVRRRSCSSSGDRAGVPPSANQAARPASLLRSTRSARLRAVPDKPIRKSVWDPKPAAPPIAAAAPAAGFAAAVPTARHPIREHRYGLRRRRLLPDASDKFARRIRAPVLRCHHEFDRREKLVPPAVQWGQARLPQQAVCPITSTHLRPEPARRAAAGVRSPEAQVIESRAIEIRPAEGPQIEVRQLAAPVAA